MKNLDNSVQELSHAHSTLNMILLGHDNKAALTYKKEGIEFKPNKLCIKQSLAIKIQHFLLVTIPTLIWLTLQKAQTFLVLPARQP